MCILNGFLYDTLSVLLLLLLLLLLMINHHHHHMLIEVDGRRKKFPQDSFELIEFVRQNNSNNNNNSKRQVRGEGQQLINRLVTQYPST